MKESDGFIILGFMLLQKGFGERIELYIREALVHPDETRGGWHSNGVWDPFCFTEKAGMATGKILHLPRLRRQFF
jgi:hypothetical protein